MEGATILVSKKVVVKKSLQCHLCCAGLPHTATSAKQQVLSAMTVAACSGPCWSLSVLTCVG